MWPMSGFQGHSAPAGRRVTAIARALGPLSPLLGLLPSNYESRRVGRRGRKAWEKWGASCGLRRVAEPVGGLGGGCEHQVTNEGKEPGHEHVRSLSGGCIGGLSSAGPWGRRWAQG